MKIWIMTIPTEEISKRELLFRLRRRAKRWQFGIEVGTHSGYEHYQVRYECSNGDYETERTFWQGIACELQEGGGWSDYECKDGNFYTSMDDCMGKYRFRGLKDFQLLIDAHARASGDRKIVAVCDHVGGTGKTFYARWKCLNGQGIYIDAQGTADRIIASVYDRARDNEQRTVIVDITRNSNQNRTDLWGAIETIKNGYLADSRYSHRDRWIPPPKLVVLCNREPKWENLSMDRWDRIFVNKSGDGSLKVWHKSIVTGEKEELTFTA